VRSCAPGMVWHTTLADCLVVSEKIGRIGEGQLPLLFVSRIPAMG
jgi:hypothetical protein